MDRHFLTVLSIFSLAIQSSLGFADRSVSQGENRCHVIPSASDELYPTLVLLGGIAQTKYSWEHQLPSLSRNRKVIVYECIGQGKSTKSPPDDIPETFINASLPFQAETLLRNLDQIVNPSELVDIAAFSFGGRVAMATACVSRGRIRKLHLSGVACDRSDYGHLAMESFKDIIINDPSLRSFAWSILLATYSSRYLRQIDKDIRERSLNNICANNFPEGLLAILDQAEIACNKDFWHVTNMADRIDPKIICKLCVGELDKMAPVDQVRVLSNKLDSPVVDILPNCGHAVVVEGARAWKNSVLSFLDEGT